MASPTNARELLTIKQVATELQVTTETVHRFIHLDQLRAFKVGRQWRIKRVDLDQYVNQGHRP